jgi:hypothetical protein
MLENGYASPRDWTMNDYRKINLSHRMSSYEVKLPVWEGRSHTHRPFAPWSLGGSLPWYQAYNDVKHSRHSNFSQANFGNLIGAVCGLIALLSAQFINEDGGPDHLIAGSGLSDGFEFATGSYFLVKFPDDWPMNERYAFDWQSLKSDPEPIQAFRY